MTDFFTPVLRRWDAGSSTWVRFGDPDDDDADVGSLVIHNSQAYVAGRGATVGTHRWDGTGWVPVMTPNPAIGVLAVWQGALLGVGEGGTHRFVNGAWERLSNATFSFTMTGDMLEHDGELFVTGQMNSQTPGLTRWNGAIWANTSILSYNTPGTVGGYSSALAARAGNLLVGGALAAVLQSSPSFGLDPAISFVQRAAPPSPVFLDTTGDAALNPGDSTVLTVDVLNAAGAAFQWRREGMDLVDGLQSDLSSISGATTDTLTLTNVAPSLSAYTLRVRTASTPICTANSAPMNITVAPGCDPIDFNRDGLAPDVQDIADFLSVFAGGACPTPTCGDIDFNNDGLVPDIADIESILTAFAGGLCP